MDETRLEIRHDAGLSLYRFRLLDAAGAVLHEAERSFVPEDREQVLQGARRLVLGQAGAERACPATAREIGTRIFSRLFDRETRERLWAGDAARPLLLGTDDPEVPWELAFSGKHSLWERRAVARDVPRPPRRAVDLAAPHPLTRVLLVVDPQENLPYSRAEAEEIQAYLRSLPTVEATLLAGGEATRDRLLERLEREAFDILHFTGHGQFEAENPTASRLYLHDRPITAAELYHTHFASRPAVVVVNACQSGASGTGEGGPEPISGLASAFLLAGAQAYVGALWPVNNRPAAYLMAAFYAQLSLGWPVGQALREAKSDCHSTFPQDPLATWGAYLLYGTPDDVPVPVETLPGTAGDLPRLFQVPLVGRADELAQLREAVDAAARGQGRLVAICGEAGVGKTRLVGELSRYAATRRACFLQGACQDAEGRPVYEPFVEAIEQFFRALPARAAREIAGDLAPELVRLAPGLGRKLGDVPAHVALDPEADRRRLFEAVTRFLAETAAQRPLLLFLDDLQWARPETLELLHYAARNLRESPVLLCATYRQEEAGDESPLSRWLAQAGREALLTTVRLPRLGEEELSQLLRSLLPGGEPEPALRQRLIEWTGGNPYFLEQWVEMLQESGSLRLEDGAWLFTGDAGGGVPQTIRDLVARRLQLLPEEDRRLLSVASVIGRQFPAELLQQVAELEEESFYDSLERLLARQLLVERRERGEEQYQFWHTLARDIVYEEISPAPRRRAWHRKVAAEIERAAQGRAETLAAELGHHYLNGGRPEQALPHLVAGARTAAGLHAYEEAVHLYTGALACLGGEEQRSALGSIGRPPARRSAEDEGGMASRLAPNWAERRAPSAERRSEATLLAIYEGRADAHLQLGGLEAAVGDLARALQLAYVAPLAEEARAAKLASIKRQLADAYRSRGAYDRATALLEQGLELARGATGVAAAREESQIAAEMAFVALEVGRFKEAEEHARRGLAVADEIGAHLLAGDARSALGLACKALGESAEAEACFRQALGLAEADADARAMASALNNLGSLCQEQGRYAEAAECYHRCLALWREMGHVLNVAAVQNNLGTIALAQGELDKAERACGEALRLFRRIDHPRGRAIAQAMRGEVALERGQLAIARKQLVEALATAEALALEDLAAYVHSLLAHVALEEGRADRAEKHGAAALRISAAIQHPFLTGTSRRALGRLARATGRFVAAREALREAQALFVTGRMDHELGRTLLELARLERDAGQPEACAAALAEARAIFTRLGAQGDLRKAEALATD
jgi:tetratricopeptide (TPR) repeat protein